ncbi:MAG: tripartite tricarboxylate transporter substrate binding protein [Devosia sp.]|nr:tripartite tricarboxylate transporter substrate binding protein [Devosia sp.]
MKRIHLLAAIVLGAVFSVSGFAQDRYPSRPVKLIVPFAPGGGTDLAARVLAEHLQTHLGQPVVVENRAGAGGIIGTEAVARAEPDGYTLGLGTISTLTVNPVLFKPVRVDPLKDLAMISTVGSIPGVMLLNPGFPARDFATALRELRAKPRAYSIGSAGVGSSVHLLIEVMNASMKTSMLHVPYRGMGPAVAAGLSGETQIVVDQFPSSVAHIRAGKLIAVAVGAKKRLESLPDVPTFEELGYPEINEMAASWSGVIAPAATPERVLARLREATAATLRDPALLARFKQMGVDPIPSSPKEFSDMVARLTERHRQIAQALNLSLTAP